MTSHIKNVTFDCADPLRMAEFWAAALGSNGDEDSTAERAYVEAAGAVIPHEDDHLTVLGGPEANEFCGQ